MNKKILFQFKYLIIFIIIVLLMGLDYVIYKKVLNKQVETSILEHAIETRNDFAQRKPATLPGEGRAILNVNSLLRVSKDSAAPKNIVLDGDAFFSIPAGQEDSVFIYTGMLKIGTTGASFRIQAHRESAGQMLEILSGQAAVYKGYPSSFPDPEFPVAGEMIMINKDIDLMEKEKFDTADLKLWLSDSLSFHQATFSQVIKNLENWFDVSFDVSGYVPAETAITKSFYHAGLTTVLDTLSKTEKFSYKLQAKANTVKIKF